MENIKYKKAFGQNFIYDTNLLKAIVKDAKVSKTDEILEIGVGAGTLTRQLASCCKKVICYEIDESLKDIINSNICEFNNVNVIFKDILKARDEEINSHFNSNFSIVANLPYYITTPIIFKFLEGDFNLKSLTIMVQKEVGERICAKSGNKNYGILSVMIQSFSDAKIVRQINRQMFTPVPNVDSCLVKIDINKSKFNIKNYNEYRTFINKCFSMRRKTLLNNLKDYKDKDKIISALQTLNIKENVRSEEISIENLIKLYSILAEN